MWQTKKLSEGALMCALTVLLSLLNRYTGFLFDNMLPWLYAFPLLIYAARYGFRMAVLPLISTCLLAFLFSSWTSFFYLGSSLLLGILYGGMVHRRCKNGWLLFLSFMMACLCNLLTMLVFAGIFGYDLHNDLIQIDYWLRALAISNLFSASALLIFFIVFLSFLQTICIHFAAQLLLTRLKISHIRMKNLLQLSSPRWLGIIILLIWLLYFMQSVIELQVGIQLMIQSFALCALLTAIIFGAVTVFAYCAVHRLPKGTIALLYLLLFIPGIHLLFALLGEADLLFGLRKAMR